MPTLDETNVRHLLRRTEVVDRESRVNHLLGLGSIEAAVDDVLSTPTPTSSASFAGIAESWLQGDRLAEFWMDRLATVGRPFAERMSFFWHGHLCTELRKARSGVLMREQIDLFRSQGLGNVRDLMKTMSLQVAMLRYLDNDLNFASSPNQNFARELLELFLLGVGNYTEADVEAATAAWTGHTDNWFTAQYSFDISQHEMSPQTFLGQTINDGSVGYHRAGFQTIDVVLRNGTIPMNAAHNPGRPSREVAADFLSYKLWQEFGEAESGSVPPAALAAMRSALLSSNFEIRPWVRAMLVSDDFYSSATRSGLVRQPFEYVVALMRATGLDAADAGQLWLMGRAGQRLFYPPNVAGWKPNNYWINASSIEARNRIAQGCSWKLHETYWIHDWDHRNQNYLQLPKGRIYASEISGFGSTPALASSVLVDRMLHLMDLGLPAARRNQIVDFCRSVSRHHRNDALLLILISPELHLA